MHAILEGENKMSIIIYCHQRSGSQLLTTTLDSHPDIKIASEAQFLLEQTPAEYFKTRNDKKKPQFTRNKMSVEGWISMLGPNEGCNVKYNQISNILSLSPEKNKIIHLVRTNILNTVVSDLINKSKKRWGIEAHIYKEDNQTYKNSISEKDYRARYPEKINIPTQIVKSHYNKIKNNIMLNHAALLEYSENVLTVHYEDLLGNSNQVEDHLNPEAISKICNFLEISNKHILTVGTKKTGKNLKKFVENYKDLQHLDYRIKL